MNKTQTRLTELAEELQTLAKDYEDAQAHAESSMLDSERRAMADFKLWLHREGYCYTRGVDAQRCFNNVMSSMKNMTSMIQDLQKQNNLLMAGGNINDPPPAFAAAQPMSAMDFLADLGLTEEDEDEDNV